MMIHISVDTNLAAIAKIDETIFWEFREGYTVRDLLDEIHLDISKVGIILINNKCASSKDSLHDNDDIRIIPVLIGG